MTLMEESEDSSIIYPLNIERPSVKSLFIEMYFGETLLSTGTAILAAKTQLPAVQLLQIDTM